MLQRESGPWIDDVREPLPPMIEVLFGIARRRDAAFGQFDVRGRPIIIERDTDPPAMLARWRQADRKIASEIDQ